MLDTRIFLGMPLNFAAVCKIYPPTVAEIAADNHVLAQGNLLTYGQEDIEEFLEQKQEKGAKVPTPLEFLLSNAYYDLDSRKMIKDAFRTFTHENVEFVYDSKMIIFGTQEEIASINDISQLRFLDEKNFFDFQNRIRDSLGFDRVDPIPEDETEFHKRIRLQSRKREQRARRKKNKGANLTVQLAAICCMGIGLTPLNIGEISYASIGKLLELYQNKEKYDIDIKSLIAGADPKKVKAQYWIGEQSEYQDITI